MKLEISILCVLPLLIATSAMAETSYECANQSGACRVQGGCAGDIGTARQQCADACPGGQITALSTTSNCTPWDPNNRRGGSAALPPVPWQVNYCRRAPSEIELEKLVRIETPFEVEERTLRTVCLPLSPSHKATEVFCWARDAYGNGGCNEGVGRSTRCEIQYSWAGATSSQLRPDGSAELCVQFYNESSNRWRYFSIGAMPEPR